MKERTIEYRPQKKTRKKIYRRAYEIFGLSAFDMNYMCGCLDVAIAEQKLNVKYIGEQDYICSEEWESLCVETYLPEFEMFRPPLSDHSDPWWSSSDRASRREAFEHIIKETSP